MNINGKTYNSQTELTADNNITVTLDFTSAIHSIYESPFAIYPNPLQNRLTIDFPSEVRQANISIFDLSGKMVRAPSIVNNGQPIDVQLENGSCIVRIHTGENIYSDLIQVMNK